MLLWLAAGSWFLTGFLFGLVTGVPELRTYGLVGTVLFGVLVWLWDRYRRVTTAPVPLREVDAFGDVDWEWPRKDRAA